MSPVGKAHGARRLPNLYIVGAPKCGTTALANYLSTHPDVFVAKKELHYFGSDLSFRHDRKRLSADEYAGKYRSAGHERYWCDASALYLMSERAAGEIAAAVPDARIIVMLRRPADMMYSLHSQALTTGQEVVTDFRTALDLEASRSRGDDIPPSTSTVELLLYRRAASFHDQVRRYLDAFPSEQVHVIIHDDFAEDVRGAYLSTLEFLGLDDDRRQEFPIVNSNHTARNQWLARFVRNPPPLVRSVGRVAVPSRRLRLDLGDAVGGRIMRANVVYARRPPMDPQLRHQLTSEFAEEVQRVETLLGRRLPWTID